MVTIVIPHYQTRELIMLCLRSIRKYTSPPYEVIVVDNDSKDDSLEYLKSVKWIKLLLKSQVVKKGSWAHGSALDIGLQHTRTEFFLALHSDVVIKDSSWLKTLLNPFHQAQLLACVGTGKLEDISTSYRVLKKLGDIKGFLSFLKRNLFYHFPQLLPEYIRTTCAAYRTEILKKEKVSFLPREEQGMTSGQALYYELVQRGYKTLSLPPQQLKQLIHHFNHGTMILNPALGARKRTISTGMRRIQKKVNQDWLKCLLEDSTFDQ